MKKSLPFSYNLVFAIALALAIPFISNAVVTCSFDRDLDLGIDGEDVRCLQQYLNDAGFLVAESGVGSPGNETSLFRDKTKDAIIRWQSANNISPASGYFGPLSRTKYNELVSGNTDSPNTPLTTTEPQDQATILMQQLEKLRTELNERQSVTSSDVQKTMKDALNQLQETEEEVLDAISEGRSFGNADDDLEDARDDFYNAVEAYLDGNMERALSFAEQSLKNSVEAFEDAGGESQRDEIEDMISDIEDMIDDAWDTIEDAEDDDKDVDEATDILEEAEDKLVEAEDALDDRDYNEAEDLVDDAEDLVDDALDAIGNSQEDSATDAIEDAKDAIDYAWNKIDRADDNGDNTNDAEDLVEEAEDLLADAEDAYDDEDWEDAIDLAEEAEDLANDALDEL